MNRYSLILIAGIVAVLLAARVHAQERMVTGCWVSTNSAGQWTDPSRWEWLKEPATLPSPIYPGTNDEAFVVTGTSVVSSANIDVGSLRLESAVLVLTNARALTCLYSLNGDAGRGSPPGTVRLDDGYLNVNVREESAPLVANLRILCGVSGGTGRVDFGARWGASSGFRPDFGSLEAVHVLLNRGGLRVDAGAVALYDNCVISNCAQEIAFRGDWLNPDRTTTVILNGKGAGGITVGGNLDFGGCILRVIAATNGVDMIAVSGNAFLTNAMLRVGRAATVQSLTNSMDLLRVPATKTIATNGLRVVADTAGGVSCRSSIDTSRQGYKYLVLTPEGFAPSVTITNPAMWATFNRGDSVQVEAAATAHSGSISKVEFYADSAKIGEATSIPYAVTWSNAYGGRYDMTAVATDSAGIRGVSSAVTIGIQGLNAEGKRVFTAGDVVIQSDPECEGQ